jgi:hypothetical protein
MTEPRRVFRRLLPDLPRLLLCVAFLYFARAIIESKTAQEILEQVCLYLWRLVIVFAIAGIALRAYWENGFLG